MSTYTVAGVTYDAATGNPIGFSEDYSGPPSITSEKRVGILRGSEVKNKDGTVKLYKSGSSPAALIFGESRPYELWSNKDGTSWSIREPVNIDVRGNTLFPPEITTSGGESILRNGIKNDGTENFISDELYNEATDIIKRKIKKDRLNGVVEVDDILFDAGDPEELNPDIIYNENGNPIGRRNSKDKATTTSGKGEENGTDIAQLEFGKVDKIIKKLHLRNLTYPLDADFGNTQDYMQISQYTYRPPNEGIFFRNQVDEDERGSFNDILKNGLNTAAPRLKEDFLGLVKLPMPNSLADSNNVSWGADQLNALTAAVSSAVFGATDNLADAFFGEKGVFDSEDFKKAGNFGKARQIIGGFGNAVDDQFIKKVREVFESATTSGSSLNVLGRTLAGSALLNAAQFGISPETVLARGQGVVPNNNMALLFNSPTLREFTFSWKMSPRSREEAIRVNNIIRFFKQGMAPKKAIGTKAGDASYFLGTPNIFDITFKTTKDGGNFFFEGDDENNSVLRIKTCACTGSAVNYTPDGMWNAYERGQPVSVTLSLRFAELEPIFDTDYDENIFEYSKKRPDLRPVPIDAVGY